MSGENICEGCIHWIAPTCGINAKDERTCAAEWRARALAAEAERDSLRTHVEALLEAGDNLAESAENAWGKDAPPVQGWNNVADVVREVIG